MRSKRKPPRPDIPDHVPDFASLPPAPDPLAAVASTGEVHSLIASVLGVDPADVADVTLICRMNDSLPTTYVWNSHANEPGSGRPDRLKLLHNIVAQVLVLLRNYIDEDERGDP